jgi:hypothetical protein
MLYGSGNACDNNSEDEVEIVGMTSEHGDGFADVFQRLAQSQWSLGRIVTSSGNATHVPLATRAAAQYGAVSGGRNSTSDPRTQPCPPEDSLPKGWGSYPELVKEWVGAGLDRGDAFFGKSTDGSAKLGTACVEHNLVVGVVATSTCSGMEPAPIICQQIETTCQARGLRYDKGLRVFAAQDYNETALKFILGIATCKRIKLEYQKHS